MESEDLYVIPHNYTDNGKIWGMIEVQSLYLAGAWFIPMAIVNFGLLPVSLNIKLFVFIVVIIPPTLLALIGVGNDTLFDFLKYVYKFMKNARVYLYEK